MILRTDARRIIAHFVRPMWDEFCPDMSFGEALKKGWPSVDGWIWLLYVDDQVPKGIFALHELDEYIEINAAFMPEFRGKDALIGAKEAFSWVFENTNYTKIVTKPYDRRNLRFFAAHCGMKRTDRGYEVWENSATL